MSSGIYLRQRRKRARLAVKEGRHAMVQGENIRYVRSFGAMSGDEG